MPAFFYILLGASLTVGASVAAGLLLIHYTRVPLKGQERYPIAFVLGSSLVSLLVFALCTLGLARKASFYVLFGGLILAAFRKVPREPYSDPLPWRILFAVIYGAYFILYFLSASLPEHSPDGVSYHLGLVGEFARAHGFVRITTNMYANLSQGIEMLFLPAYSIGRHSAASLVHFAFLAALPLLILNYARRVNHAVAGVCAAVLVFAAPVMGMDGTSAYNDVAVAAAVFSVFYLIEIWRDTRTPALLALAGLAAGFCYASKYTAFLAVPYALIIIIRKELRWRPVLLFCACASISILPWMLKNWIWLQNPVSPFLNAVFPNPYVYIDFERDYVRLMRQYEGLASYWQIPLEVTVRGGALAGFFGPVYLLAPLSLLALRDPVGRRLLIAALIFGSTYFGNIGTRFLISCIPFIALALAIALERWKPVLMSVMLIHAVLSWPTITSKYCSMHAWRLGKPDWKAALRIQPEEHFLQENVGGYVTVRMIERVTPPGSRILSFATLPDAYLTRRMVVGYQSAQGNDLLDIIHMGTQEAQTPSAREFFAFDRRQLTRVRLRQTAAGTDQWSISEFRLYDGKKEVPRSKAWRIRTNVYPWSIQRAMDNSLATRWRSGEALRPGMIVEVDFGGVVEADRVLLQTAHDHYQAKVVLEGMDINGAWHELDRESDWEPPRPLIGMRAGASAEIKAMGIGYLLLLDSDYVFKDFQGHEAEWNVRVVGETPGAVLYKFE